MMFTTHTGSVVNGQGRVRHVAHATSQRVVKRSQPVTPGPSKTYSITEITGSEERDLLANSTASSPSSSTSTSDRPPHLSSSAFTSLPTNVRDLFLPPGFPATVTPDYLPYQLWSFPTHVTGHLSHSLVTSSLLAAVGVSTSPAATVALSASIKWIVKDGVGALGRLIVGSRFSAEFDEDPRRWRLVAELLATLGLGLEVATSLQPQYFLALACAGKFCQALGKGMGKPVFRVIQTHFARAQNVGAVAAKEEVWEVVAQMAGLAASVAVLRALEGTGSAEKVVTTWAAVQAVHVALRYLALRTLLFDSLSLKRAALLTSAWVRDQPLPNVAQANAQEPLLADPGDLRPRVRMGCSAAEAFGGVLPPPGVLQAYTEAYDGEGYVLVWRDGEACVVLKEGHCPRDLVRAVWQAAWLDRWAGQAGDGGDGTAAGPRTPGDGVGSATSSNGHSSFDGASSSKGGDQGSPVAVGHRDGMQADRGPGSVGDEGQNGAGAGQVEGGGEGAEGLRLARLSLAALSEGFGPFIRRCEEEGWQVGVVHVKAGRSRLRVVSGAGGEEVQAG